jgi:uncharacterized protein YebE (UPF0316 family)
VKFLGDIILLIVVQILYVPLLALRTISMVKKLTLLTAMFGFMESIIYVFGLAIVFTGEQSFLQMFVYALGFAIGLIVGIQIENKIAIGYTSIMVNIRDLNQELVDKLRESGYGVTIFNGQGKDSIRYRLDILTKRSRENELMNLIEEHEPHAFVLAYEPTRFKGGYMEIMMKRNSLKRINLTGAKVQKKKVRNWFIREKNRIVMEVNELRKSDDDITL